MRNILNTIEQKPLVGTLLDASSGLSRGLVGAWLFNEGSGTLVHDLSGNGIDVPSLYNNEGWVPGGILFSQATAVALSVTPKEILPTGTNPYSIIIKIRTTSSNSSYDTALAYNSYNPSWMIHGGTVVIYDSGNKTSTTTVTVGVDTTIGWIRRGTGANETDIYKDGVYDSSITHADSLSPGTLRLGWSGSSSEYVEGVIYYIYIYDRALSAQEVRLLYQDPYQMWPESGVWLAGTIAGGANAPTGGLYGPLYGPMGGPI